MIRVDEGHKLITTLSRTYGQLRLADANEAETRLKVIDEILFTALGWSKDDNQLETRVSEDGNNEFADYPVRTAVTTLLIGRSGETLANLRRPTPPREPTPMPGPERPYTGVTPEEEHRGWTAAWEAKSQSPEYEHYRRAMAAHAARKAAQGR
jgi:hypothetical protein